MLKAKKGRLILTAILIWFFRKLMESVDKIIANEKLDQEQGFLF
jgi:hypothetical protein